MTHFTEYNVRFSNQVNDSDLPACGCHCFLCQLFDSFGCPEPRKGMMSSLQSSPKMLHLGPENTGSLSPFFPPQVWTDLRHTGFLPFMAHQVSNMSQMIRWAGLRVGRVYSLAAPWTSQVWDSFIRFQEASLCLFTFAPWPFSLLEIEGMKKDKASETVGLGAQRLLWGTTDGPTVFKARERDFSFSSNYLSSWELTLQPRESRGIWIQRLGFPFLSQSFCTFPCFVDIPALL